jgi:hypothetical protein
MIKMQLKGLKESYTEDGPRGGSPASWPKQSSPIYSFLQQRGVLDSKIGRASMRAPLARIRGQEISPTCGLYRRGSSATPLFQMSTSPESALTGPCKPLGAPGGSGPVGGCHPVAAAAFSADLCQHVVRPGPGTVRSGGPAPNSRIGGPKPY